VSKGIQCVCECDANLGLSDGSGKRSMEPIYRIARTVTGTKGLHVPGCTHSIFLAESQLLQDLVHSSFGVAACTAAQPTVHIHEVHNLTLLCNKYNLNIEKNTFQKPPLVILH
jgi:hypothetical protein